MIAVADRRDASIGLSCSPETECDRASVGLANLNERKWHGLSTTVMGEGVPAVLFRLRWIIAEFPFHRRSVRRRGSLSSWSVFMALIACCIVGRDSRCATVSAGTTRDCPLGQCLLEFSLRYWLSFWPECCHYMVKISHRELTLRNPSPPIARQSQTPALSSQSAVFRRRTASLKLAARGRVS
jgi:hypothetical protein